MDNKYIALAVTLAVGVILAGSVLMPVLNNVDYGRATYSNNIGDNYRVSDLEESISLNVIANGEPITGTVGDSVVSFPVTWSENYIFVSDRAVFIQSYNGYEIKGMYGWFFDDAGSQEAYHYVTPEESFGSNLSYDPETKTVTYSNGATTYSAVVNWQYHISNSGDYRTFQTTADWYANKDALIVAGGGYYGTGENDTTYAYYAFNEERFINSGQFDGRLIVNSSEVAKNVIKCNATVQIGDETFVPWNVIIPVSVTSTENGTWESMFMAIPIFVLVMLLAAAAKAVAMRDD